LQQGTIKDSGVARTTTANGRSNEEAETGVATGAPQDAHLAASPKVGDARTLEQRYPHPERILIAIRLAKDIDTCEQLLRGEPVDPDRIDQAQLRWAKQRFLVRLDMRAIDLLAVA
jgi:hypothetical protein